MRQNQDPILIRFRAALEELYGDRLDRVVLFGSRARGDGGPESDYDVAVFLTSLPDRWRELNRLADLRVRFLEDAGVFSIRNLIRPTAYQDRTPLMHEIRRDGLDL